MSFLSQYKNFLNTLENISVDHDELTDTDVRERLHEVLNWYFIWDNPLDEKFPQKYAMFSAQGDAKVAYAVHHFIELAKVSAKDVSPGQERNEILENFDIETDSGASYDMFLGSIDDVLPAEIPSSDEIYGKYQ